MLPGTAYNTQVETIISCQIATQSRNAIRESSRICRCCSFAGLVHGGAGMRLETRPYLTLLQDRPTRKVPVETARGGGWVCGGGERAEHEQRRRVGGAFSLTLDFSSRQSRARARGSYFMSKY